MATKENAAPDPLAAVPQTSVRKVKLSNTRQTQPERPSLSLDQNGRMEMTITTTRAVLKMAEGMGFKPGYFLLDVNIDEADFATFTPVDMHTPDAGKITLNKNGTSSMQLRELFDQYPDYQPVVRQRFTPIFTTDASGRPCMAIGLKLGQDFHKIPRKHTGK